MSSSPIFNAGTERFVRDWRSAICTVTVRDQRNRQHDPILGVVPLKLSDLLDTRSQVTRWYPLDGGIGFGRIRISVLFRSVETRLPPNMLGWDVGTFEFTSERLVALNYNHHAGVKLRTGGSVGKIGASQCRKLDQGSGYFWDLAKKDGKNNIQLPVKYRYRSPVIIELHRGGSRKADGYAMIWLQHIIDNEETPFDVPIWKTKNYMRLTQNYITEENLAAKQTPGLEDLEEIGRLQFKGVFTAGMNESHEHFVSDNNSRETFETWEACYTEGVRQRYVDKELPEKVQQLHNESLVEGRDVLKAADDQEKEKWLARDGADWSGAFGQNPKAWMKNGKKHREPGAEPPVHDPINPSSDDDSGASDGDSDLGIQDASNTSHRSDRGMKSMDTNRSVTSMQTTDTTVTNSSIMNGSPSEKQQQKAAKKAEERHHRGLMQWKPARNLKFAKDEGVLGMRKLKNKMTGGLEGRQPGVESEAA